MVVHNIDMQMSMTQLCIFKEVSVSWEASVYVTYVLEMLVIIVGILMIAEKDPWRTENTRTVVISWYQKTSYF